MFIITRDGKPTYGRYPDENAILAQFHKRVGYSMDHAIKFEGYGVVEVPDDRWSELEAAPMRRLAEQQLSDHGHKGRGDELTRENCAACVLAGYHADNKRGPGYVNWARVYVQAGKPIPNKWLAAFQRERTGANDDEPNQAYIDALALDIATWGVRSEDGNWLTPPLA